MGASRQGTPPLFHADELQVEIHVESFWGRKISLGNVDMSHFSAHVRVEPDGSTNIPGPKTQPDCRQVVLSKVYSILKIARLRLEDGEILWNDTRMPLAAEGGHFEFSMEYGNDAGRPVYLGQVSWQKFRVAALPVYPVRIRISPPDSLSGRIHFR